MGIIKKQAIYNSIYQYIGIIIGYVNIVILFPLFLDTDQFGLTRVLIAISALYVQFSALGINQINIKFFPFFKNHENKNHGFFFLGLIITLIGFTILTTLYLLLDDSILNQYQEQSDLFLNNYYIVIPLSLFLLYFGYCESYLQGLYKTVLSSFIKNVLTRVIWAVDLFLYHWKIITFDHFLIIFIGVYALGLIILLIYLIGIKEISLKPDKKYLRPRILKLISNYGLFSVLSGISNITVNHIDKIMITFILGLSDTGIYALAAYVSSIIFVPTQAISRISFPVISYDWKHKRLKNIALLYKRTAILQLILGGFIFILIWANIDNIFRILPPEYAAGKWVILYIGLARLFEMATGTNGMIIMASKYYRFNTTSSLILIVLSITTNLILIPIYGIDGAAMATAFSIFTVKFIRFLFVYIKLNMQPYSFKTVAAIFVIIVSILPVYIIPSFESLVLDIFVKTTIIVIIFIPLSYFLKISEDLNDYLDKFFRKLNKIISFQK
ncbi:lipopolysaccharide biosynthesis protein [Bacteroidota bacterium]